jgi:hypothetical protein
MKLLSENKKREKLISQKTETLIKNSSSYYLTLDPLESETLKDFLQPCMEVKLTDAEKIEI